ncbi:Methyltransferase domain-containing protein [[Clostridium] fimetarium]|uniref:Methyltransferase domain-containing protein n=2 Tax=[Clostridium] fimetarium TaxID=99656 RepID=A0A1I0R320_9FIRM|nr:Methyltransferase domain-containing protein [[Clostridium] fimetarium]
MEAYTGFAEVYDIFMDNIPYEQWAQYVIRLLKDNGVNAEDRNCSIVDLGCGTGTFTEILSNAGFNMIGIDNSQEMLMIASSKKYRNIYESEDCDESEECDESEKCEELEECDESEELENSDSIIYTLQDMRDFAVPAPVSAVVSVCDSMNYIIEEDELLEVFKCVKKALEENGVFIFDMKTQHFFRDVLGENTIAENRENAAFIWDNYYYEDESLNEYEMTIFIEEENGLFRKYEETHVQRGYTIEEVKQSLATAGLEILNIYDAFTQNPPTDNSERIYFVVKEKINN